MVHSAHRELPKLPTVTKRAQHANTYATNAYAQKLPELPVLPHPASHMRARARLRARARAYRQSKVVIPVTMVIFVYKIYIYPRLTTVTKVEIAHCAR